MRVSRPGEWKVTSFIQVLSGEASLRAGSLAAWWILIWLRSSVHRSLVETRKSRFGVRPPPPLFFVSVDSTGLTKRPLVSVASNRVKVACLVTAHLVLEPSKHVGVEANGERLLGGPIEFADNSVAPVQHFGNVREINLVIRQGSKS